MLDPVAAAQEDLIDESRREEPVLDDARRGREPSGQLRRIPDRAQIVSDRVAVRTRRRVAKLRRSERGQGRLQPEREHLERNRGREVVHELVRGDDDDEPVRCCRRDLLARVRAAAALDQPTFPRDLVCSVDCDVEAVEGIEALDDEPELRARTGRRYSTVEPVPRPTRMPSSTSSAAASAAARFSCSRDVDGLSLTEGGKTLQLATSSRGRTFFPGEDP